ncbi:MAG: hypothetical protein IJU75_02155 [Clostridia bacterium]|nr:hypothetical protein [Clostridia bacterium]
MKKYFLLFAIAMLAGAALVSCMNGPSEKAPAALNSGEPVEDATPGGCDASGLRIRYERVAYINEEYPLRSVTVARSKEDLKPISDIYLDYARKNTIDKEYVPRIVNDLGVYDDAFFDEKNLIVVRFDSGSGSIRFKVTGVENDENGDLTVSVDKICPEMGTADMAAWAILIETDSSFIPGRATENSLKMSDVILGGFRFGVRWGCYGISSYDLSTGKLVKTTDATHPENYVTYFRPSLDEQYEIYKMIVGLDVFSYPDEFDPFNAPDAEERVSSEPSATIELYVTIGGSEKRITAPNVCLSYRSEYEKGQKFLDVVKYITDILTSSKEWEALPDYEVYYE